VELAEEVGLQRDDVRLCGVGVPVRVDDEAEGRYWLVYPFLFSLKHGREPQLDWESIESRWVAPGEVASLDTVPGLPEVVARVWPPVRSPALWRAAEQIAADRLSGATHLALQALRALGRFCQTREGAASRVPAAQALASLRPSMGVLPHVMALGLRRSRTQPQAVARTLAAATDRVAALAARALADTRCVLTHSASAACEAALLAWAKAHPRAEVIATESRPRLEGAALAGRLAARGVQVKLISDAQMATAVREVEAVLVGADAIADDGLLVNKAGTRLVGLAARDAGVPVYAACQTHKIAPPGWPIALEHQDPADVSSSAELRVRNVAFDATPLDWFTSVITESGPLTHALLAATRARLARSGLLPSGDGSERSTQRLKDRDGPLDVGDLLVA
jgi:translation initiation factor 2B subunit (eIF-2B alpha/beta/delta family)